MSELQSTVNARLFSLYKKEIKLSVSYINRKDIQRHYWWSKRQHLHVLPYFAVQESPKISSLLTVPSFTTTCSLIKQWTEKKCKDWYQTVVKSRAYECNHSAQKCFLLTGDLINFSFNTSKYLNQDQLAKARLWDVLEKFN